MAVSDWSTDADLNVSIDGINIAEGCPPSNVNNALRAIMANVRLLQEAIAAEMAASFLSQTGGTVSGTLVLSKTTDASGKADNGPALVVGGTRTQAHIEVDGNELMAKASGTTVAPLYLNSDGGAVNAEGQRVVKGTSKGGTAKGVYIDANGFAQPMSATVGSGTKPIFASAGQLTACNGNVGNANTPLFMQGGQLKACNGYDTILKMVPSGNPQSRSSGTTYTAATNGFVIVRSQKSGGCVRNNTVTVNGYTYNLQQSHYGSGSCTNYIHLTIPCKKGWKYVGHTDWIVWVPAS